MFLNYFFRYTKGELKGDLIFKRKIMKVFPEYNKLDNNFLDVNFYDDKSIEEDYDSLQMDFSNPFIGFI
jgi:hypothetical protein